MGDGESLQSVKDEQKYKKRASINLARQSSHTLVERAVRRVIAPYVQVLRKDQKREIKGEPFRIDLDKFKVFLEDEVNIPSLLYETAIVLKTCTNSSGVFLYMADEDKEEIVMYTREAQENKRHQVNYKICEGRTVAAHVAATKEYLVIDNMTRDTRFSEGSGWAEAKVDLCMPVVKPDGRIYSVIELYKNTLEPYDKFAVNSVLCCTGWAGAAAHQTEQRITLQRKAQLNAELLNIIQQYFCDFVSLELMIAQMLSIAKHTMAANRSSFFILNDEEVGEKLMADMFDDSWNPMSAQPVPMKKTRVNLNLERSVAGMVAREGKPLNVRDNLHDPRFDHDIDPVTGAVLRNVLAEPVLSKSGLIGVVQVMNKNKKIWFDKADEEVFKTFVSYCSLIVHFSRMEKKMKFAENLNKVYDRLMTLHMNPCDREFVTLMETQMLPAIPPRFGEFDFYLTEDMRPLSPSLTCYMINELFPQKIRSRENLAKFVLTTFNMYRQNPYHNKDHAFVFTHTMFNILTRCNEYFSIIELIGLLIGGLCHDLDHPGLNNNFLSLSRHPLASMYSESILENHHYFIAKKIVLESDFLNIDKDSDEMTELMEEMRYNIICTDLALYFRMRADLSKYVTDKTCDLDNPVHKNLIKGILMTTCDLSAMAKPFEYAKMVTECVYEEFYNQGDMERMMGFVPLSMMDRTKSINQPMEQIQFLAVVVLPCLILLQGIFSNLSVMTDLCKNVQDSWHEVIEIRGQKTWKQDESIASHKRH